MTLLQQQLNEMNIKYNEEVNKNAAIKRGSTSSNNNVVAAGVSSSSIAKRKFIVKSSSNQQSSSSADHTGEVSKENKMIDQEEIKGTYLDEPSAASNFVSAVPNMQVIRQRSSNSSSPRHLQSSSIQDFEEDDPYGAT
jgi:hypothetical protein